MVVVAVVVGGDGGGDLAVSGGGVGCKCWSWKTVMEVDGDSEETVVLLNVACLCVNQNSFRRPSIREVVDYLENVGTANKQTA